MYYDEQYDVHDEMSRESQAAMPVDSRKLCERLHYPGGDPECGAATQCMLPAGHAGFHSHEPMEQSVAIEWDCGAFVEMSERRAFHEFLRDYAELLGQFGRPNRVVIREPGFPALVINTVF